MAGLNRTNHELSQMIAALPSNMRGLLQEILYEISSGSTQRTLASSTSTYLDGITEGQAIGSKALVVTPNRDISALRKVGCTSVVMATNSANATGGAATLNATCGKVTSESLTTASGSEYTLTLSNTACAAADRVFASVCNDTNAQGIPVITTVLPAANTITIKVKNDGTQAFNGKIVISFFVVPVT